MHALRGWGTARAEALRLTSCGRTITRERSHERIGLGRNRKLIIGGVIQPPTSAAGALDATSCSQRRDGDVPLLDGHHNDLTRMPRRCNRHRHLTSCRGVRRHRNLHAIPARRPRIECRRNNGCGPAADGCLHSRDHRGRSCGRVRLARAGTTPLPSPAIGPRLFDSDLPRQDNSRSFFQTSPARR